MFFFSLVSAIVIIQNVLLRTDTECTLIWAWGNNDGGPHKTFNRFFELLTSCNCCHGHNREEIFPEGVDRKTPRGHPVSPLETGHKGDSVFYIKLSGHSMFLSIYCIRHNFFWIMLFSHYHFSVYFCTVICTIITIMRDRLTLLKWSLAVRSLFCLHESIFFCTFVAFRPLHSILPLLVFLFTLCAALLLLFLIYLT